GNVRRRLVPCPAETVHGNPVFNKVLDTMRRYKLMLHLRLKSSTLKFNVLVAAIGELIDPDVAIVISAPSPGLFPWQLSMISDMHNAPVGLFVVDAKEITF